MMGEKLPNCPKCGRACGIRKDGNWPRHKIVDRYRRRHPGLPLPQCPNSGKPYRQKHDRDPRHH